ncbi:MAG: hypothetical protein J6A69_03360 [Clostridia bacterium]|nr:hypothetical protein [Clostridia bacterium]
MKKIFLVLMVFCVIFSLSGCKKNALTEADMMSVVNENGLNVLNAENCGFKGDELTLKVSKVNIEKSNVFEDDASCDIEVLLEGDEVNAKLYYRCDLTKAKKGWTLKTVKNYQRFVLMPIKGVDDATALEEIENEYPLCDKFVIESNTFDEENRSCEVVASFERENEISVASGKITCKYVFDEKELEWVRKSCQEDVEKVGKWTPHGKWYFTDDKYFYCIEITDFSEKKENAKINVVASEHKSVVYTADFQQTADVLVTADNNRIYFEPFDVEIGEETVSLMLCLREEALYFHTDNTDDYEKVNLTRISNY